MDELEKSAESGITFENLAAAGNQSPQLCHLEQILCKLALPNSAVESV